MTDILKPLGCIAVIRISEIVSAKYVKETGAVSGWVELIYRNGRQECIIASDEEWSAFMEDAKHEY